LRTPITCNNADIDPGTIVEREFVWEDDKFGEADIYQALAPADKTEMKVALVGLRLAQ
jgi:hypothetical protein